MNILITICARGGSKGIPSKNIKILNGKPLIGYSIYLANKVKEYYETVDIELSTDSEEIKCVSEKCGLKSDYNRPENLANDTCGKVDAINDIVRYAEKKYDKKYDYVLDLDCTSPLRNLDDIIAAFNLIKSDKEALNLFSVSEPARNPYFNQVERKNNGYYAQVKLTADGLVFSRQAAPEVYDLNASFYIYTTKFFKMGLRGAITPKSLVYVVPHICFDMDHPLDFEITEFLLSQNKLDFNL